MAEPKDAHVVEIPTNVEDQQHGHEDQQQVDVGAGPLAVQPSSAAVSAMQHHPLTEISQSPGHLLLLKLWQREEDLFGRRIGAMEIRLEETKREVFRLCWVFFAFHGLFLSLLFASSVDGRRRGMEEGACRDWWVPCFLSLLTSLVLVCAVHVRLCGFWKATARLQIERGGARSLARCVQELRMKGASFDLSREPAQGACRRMKSASVEVRWKRPLQWCRRHLVTLCLLGVTGAAVPACKFILCALGISLMWIFCLQLIKNKREFRALNSNEIVTNKQLLLEIY
ncbi:hypothetical protein Taro_054051 [Colocasia esculenta]|uniref:Uncharacterized protein n=1 Tax=Colocasia esculenta TaxID=4460 RepID=A0A843XPJ7_COLES|nr:hypothetical protein [Colocasia esculenta]